MTIKPNIFLTSDTHFGHQSIVDWGHRKPTHNEDMIASWNACIRKEQHPVILHLGDLTFANRDQTEQWVKQLGGEKYLIKGNHDNKSDKWYQDLGFTVIPPAYFQFQDKYGKWYRVLFTHEPVMPLPFDQRHTGDEWFNIHGHLHGDNHRNIFTTENHFDVGTDAHNHGLLQLAQIMSFFKSRN